MKHTTGEFNFELQDSTGRTAPTHLIGKRFLHSGNNHVYTITDVAWDGRTNEWALIHERDDTEVSCVRTVENFFGYRSNGEKRYQQVME